MSDMGFCPGSVCCAIHKDKRYCTITMKSRGIPHECDCVYARLPCEVGSCQNAEYCEDATKAEMLNRRHNRDRARMEDA